jgi:hypothetical protein
LPEHLPHSQDLSVFASLNTSWQSGQNRSFIVYKDTEPLWYYTKNCCFFSTFRGLYLK